MFIVSIIFFYTLPASLIFLQGIGLERLSMNARSTRVVIPFILRDGAVMLISASLSWLLEFSILLPLDIVSITPIAALIIVYLCDLAVHRIFFKHSESRLIRERLFSGGTVVFALYQERLSKYACLVVYTLRCQTEGRGKQCQRAMEKCPTITNQYGVDCISALCMGRCMANTGTSVTYGTG